MGRHNTLAWGMTAAQLDTSDLWQEEINSDFTKYKVDGEWRELTFREEIIKVKGQDPIHFKIAYTHRGPIIDLKTLRFNTSTMYGVKNPDLEFNLYYSLGWAKNEVDDRLYKTVSNIWISKDVHEVMAHFDEEGRSGFKGFSGNFHFGDTDGNIAF